MTSLQAQHIDVKIEASQWHHKYSIPCVFDVISDAYMQRTWLLESTRV